MALLAGSLWAQEPVRLQRTPEEEALKQTMRLVRELGIQDSVRFDTLYRMHLKQRMQAIYDELKVLLTPEEFERFMNHPAEQPRRPRGAGVLAPAKQGPPTQHQSADHK